MSKFLLIALLIITLISGMGLGYFISPQYAMAAYEAKQMGDLGKSDRYTDLRYINAMIAHHRGAMLLAEQAKSNSRRPEVTSLAKAILADEPKAIDELYAWKKLWYNDTAAVADMEVPNLGTYDDKFDLRFLNALIAHHESGVEMAAEVKLKSTRLEILNNADAVYDFLSGGISMLSDWRQQWYLTIN